MFNIIEFFTDYIKTNPVIFTICLIVWILGQWWLIRRILQSKVISTKERVLWIILCIVSSGFAMFLYLTVTKERYRNKYHPVK